MPKKATSKNSKIIGTGIKKINVSLSGNIMNKQKAIPASWLCLSVAGCEDRRVATSSRGGIGTNQQLLL